MILKGLLKIKNHGRYLLLSGFFMLFSLILIFSCVSYNPIDLVETNGEMNFIGPFGANLANFLLQYFGFAFYIMPLSLLRWAFLTVVEKRFYNYKKRVGGMLLSLLLLCFLLGAIKSYELFFVNPIGGYVGSLIVGLFMKTPFFIPLTVFSVLLLGVSVTCSLDLNLEKFRSKINLFLSFVITLFRRKKTSHNIIQAKPESVKVQSIVLSTEKKIYLAPHIAEKINMNVKYIPPSLSLLSFASLENQKKNQRNIASIKKVEKDLTKALLDFQIQAEIKESKVGPVITMHEIEPSPGIRAARIIGLADDISRCLKAKSARISLIPGKSSLAVEIPNLERETVFLREILDSIEFKESDFNIPIALGKSIIGDNIVVDLTTMPHLLVAGTTGSGKSVGVNAMILSILYKLSPSDCRFIMVDPKMLELSVYNDIPHLLSPVVTDPEKAVLTLKWLVLEMEKRYKLMSAFSVRNIFGYNREISRLKALGIEKTEDLPSSIDPEEIKNLKKMPFIILVIDEMADLMLTAGKAIEACVQRLAQMARAAGIHVIMATQRPSVDVITGVIKANFPTRISYQVTSGIDSRTIIGMQGAESLLGKGDMLYMPSGGKTYRVHAPFVSDSEVNSIVASIKKTYGSMYDSLKVDIFEDMPSELKEDILSGDSAERAALFNGGKNSEEALYEEAKNIVLGENKPSISYLQRRLKIGYNKAANLIERMEREGIISGAEPSTGKRMILKKVA